MSEVIVYLECTSARICDSGVIARCLPSYHHPFFFSGLSGLATLKKLNCVAILIFFAHHFCLVVIEISRCCDVFVFIQCRSKI